jgi:hypothetical protein
MPKYTGLRVAKEDKHTNLIRGRAMKAQVQAQSQSVSKVCFCFPAMGVSHILPASVGNCQT